MKQLILSIIGFALVFASCTDPNGGGDTTSNTGETGDGIITYTLSQSGGQEGTADSTHIVITFDKALAELDAREVVVSGAAQKIAGLAAGTGNTLWHLPITVSGEGEARVTINRDGVDSEPHGVAVFKDLREPPEEIIDDAPAAPEDAPVLSSVSGLVPGLLEIKWAEANGVSHYNLYRGTTEDFSPGEKINPRFIQGTSYVDHELTGGTAYYYKVKAVNSKGEGPASGALGGTALAGTVTPLSLNVWADVEISAPGAAWFSVPVDTATRDKTLYLWGNTASRNDGLGDKTMYAGSGMAIGNRYTDNGVSVTAHALPSADRTAHWNSPAKLFMPDEPSGMVYFSIVCNSSGTFGIVCGASSMVRPPLALPPALTAAAEPLTLNQWTDGEITAAGEGKWYTITYPGSGYVSLNANMTIRTDICGNGIKNLYWGELQAFCEDGSVPPGWASSVVSTTWTTPKAVDGGGRPVYFLVQSGLSEIGTFGIVFSSQTPVQKPAFNPPAPVPLIENTWVDDEITSSPHTYGWYTINVSAGTTYSVWGNGSGVNGDGTKTLALYLMLFKNDGSFFTGWSAPVSGKWDMPRSFTPDTNGVVYLRVASNVGRAADGTYGIVYSTTNTRPE
jgi:hypothetical protein